MDKIINQFRRLYDDKGANDRDFSQEESRLKDANDRLVRATGELVRSSERLNTAAISVQRSNNSTH